MDLIYNESDFADIFLVALTKISDETIIGLQYNSNRIYEMDLTTNRIHFFMEIPIEQEKMFKLYQTAILHDGKIYYLPFNCSAMAIFDIQSSEIKMINLPELSTCDKGRIINGYINGNILTMIPYACGLIIQFDLNIEQIVKVCDIRNKISCDDLFCSFVVKEDGTLILPSMSSNKLLFVNPHKDVINVKELSSKNDCYAGIVMYEDVIWLALKNRFGFLKYDMKIEQCEIIDMPPDEFVFEGGSCFDAKNIFQTDDKMICMPGNANCAIEVNLKSHKAVEIKKLRALCNAVEIDKNRYIFDGNCTDGDIKYLCYQNLGLLEYNLKTEESNMHLFRVDATSDCLKFLIKKMQDL
ncbi:MAG: hypothetical protein ACI4HQ_05810 [Acetatifactor sp.]